LEQLLLSTTNGINEENAQRKEERVNALVDSFKLFAVEEKILFLIRIREHCNSFSASGYSSITTSGNG